ncbi:porphobilinogen synthase [Brachyspira pilosicoli]|uniref:porphobilinogen synthase n=1 Tax=Brachyspira pilosicoli TaxID=52584 RepID=UPI001CA4EDDF|nr:porphobilinogen synthase [Brachyspira pilosicoli]MBW5396295.1 porphobilinogen synthase [Brachyspira pilosicoli]
MFKRTRRTRNNAIIRDLISDVNLTMNDFLYPIFIEEGNNIKKEIEAMPNQFRLSIDKLKEELEDIVNLGIRGVLLFGIPKNKDEIGSSSFDENGIIQNAVKYIKLNFPNLLVVTDVCMCEYTSHGHCGILCGNNVDNDSTLEYISKIALSHVQAGSDIVAPSDCMDGHVYAIRNILDKNGYYNTPIMSYSVKYASCYYSPFRMAADSAPSFGDRKSYQMDFRNSKEYIRKIENDIEEGADIFIIKPALSYLDVIKDVSNNFNIPIAAYNVSGEYSMIKAASKLGFIDEKRAVLENMYALKRAGADIIITYHAKDLSKYLKEL